MDWWIATLVILAFSAGSIITRNSLLSFATLMAFMPLALHTLYNDFERFWILVALSLAVEIAAIMRNASTYAIREPIIVVAERLAAAYPDPASEAKPA